MHKITHTHIYSTASIVYNQWNGSEKEKYMLLELQRARQRKALVDRSAFLPNGGVSVSILMPTATSARLQRTKSPNYPHRREEKDPLDIGEGWYQKHHIPTKEEIRAGNHLHYHVGELTSLNYKDHINGDISQGLLSNTSGNEGEEEGGGDIGGKENDNFENYKSSLQEASHVWLPGSGKGRMSVIESMVPGIHKPGG